MWDKLHKGKAWLKSLKQKVKKSDLKKLSKDQLRLLVWLIQQAAKGKLKVKNHKLLNRHQSKFALLASLKASKVGKKEGVRLLQALKRFLPLIVQEVL